jgi:hypothetical protein
MSSRPGRVHRAGLLLKKAPDAQLPHKGLQRREGDGYAQRSRVDHQLADRSAPVQLARHRQLSGVQGQAPAASRLKQLPCAVRTFGSPQFQVTPQARHHVCLAQARGLLDAAHGGGHCPVEHPEAREPPKHGRNLGGVDLVLLRHRAQGQRQGRHPPVRGCEQHGFELAHLKAAAALAINQARATGRRLERQVGLEAWQRLRHRLRL